MYLTHIVIEELNNISDSDHVLKTYYVPGTVQNPCLIFTTPKVGTGCLI